MRKIVSAAVLVFASLASAQVGPRFQCAGVQCNASIINWSSGCSCSPPTLTIGGGSGTVTSVACGNSLTCSPSPIVGAGTISLPNTISSSSGSGNTFTITSGNTSTAAAGIVINGEPLETGPHGRIFLQNHAHTFCEFIDPSTLGGGHLLMRAMDGATIKSSLFMTTDQIIFADHTEGAGPTLIPAGSNGGSLGANGNSWGTAWLGSAVTGVTTSALTTQFTHASTFSGDGGVGGNTASPIVLDITPTFDLLATGGANMSGYTVLFANVTSTNIGSGPKLLADLRVNTFTQFSVDSTGVASANFFKTLTALSGGGTGDQNPTLGTNFAHAGAGNPTVAAQNSWLQMKDSTGATIYVPVWK